MSLRFGSLSSRPWRSATESRNREAQKMRCQGCWEECCGKFGVLGWSAGKGAAPSFFPRKTFLQHPHQHSPPSTLNFPQHSSQPFSGFQSATSTRRCLAPPENKDQQRTLEEGEVGEHKKYRRIPNCEVETSRDESQCVPSPDKPFKTRDLELPIFKGSLPSCSPHSAGYTCTSVHPYFRGQNA